MNTTDTKRRATALVARCIVLLGVHAAVAGAQETDDRDLHHDIDEIIVSAAALERTVEQLAQPTDILAGDELAKRQSTSIGETVSGELGVSSSYFGPISSRPVIRGQFGERVRVLTNALDSLDASALSEDHAVSVDGILAERVEIVRGPATLLYGSGAAGGLVNVVDNRILERRLDVPFGGAVSLGSDSATGKRSGAGRVAFGTDNIAFHLDYSRLDTDNIEIPDFAESALLRALEEEEAGGGEEEEEEEAFGVVENTDSETESGAAAITLTGDNGYFGISLSRYDSQYGIPGGHGHHEEEEEPVGGEEEEEEENVRIDLEQTRFDVKGELALADNARLKLRAGFNDYEHVELEGAEIGTLFETQGTDLRLELHHGVVGPVEGAFGLQYKEIDFDAIGEEAFVPASVTEQTSLFLFEEWSLNDRWTLQGSARAERQNIALASLENHNDTAFGVSVGAIWSFADDYSVALNYALTERNPTATELYADGAHVAVQRVERGSVVQGAGLLDKERSSNIDLTFRGDSALVEWAITGFINDVEDYIVLSPTAEIEDELQVFNYGQTDARLYGIEAEARIELLDTAAGHLHTRLFTDFVRGEDDVTGENLPRIPPLRYGIGLHYTMERFEAGVEASFHDEQDRTAPNELPTEDYVLLSAELSYAFDEPNVFLFARGTNLTDEDARQHTSPLKDLVPLPGRSLQLGLRYDF